MGMITANRLRVRKAAAATTPKPRETPEEHIARLRAENARLRDANASLEQQNAELLGQLEAATAPDGDNKRRGRRHA